MISEDELKELSALAEKATPGPWAWVPVGEKVNGYQIGTIFDKDGKPLSGYVDECDVDGNILDEELLYKYMIGEVEAAVCNYCDADFIAASREAVPKLIAAVRRLQAGRTGEVPQPAAEPHEDGDEYYSFNYHEWESISDKYASLGKYVRRLPIKPPLEDGSLYALRLHGQDYRGVYKAVDDGFYNLIPEDNAVDVMIYLRLDRKCKLIEKIGDKIEISEGGK